MNAADAKITKKMFVQNEVYVPTEYGTRECQADREPCGAFYGVPFSGEIDGQALYDRQQIYEALPDRWFSPRDEKILAHMRGEDVEWESEVVKTAKIQSLKHEPKLVEKLVKEFILDTNAPPDIVLQYKLYARKYANGEWRLLNELLDLYEKWSRRRT